MYGLAIIEVVFIHSYFLGFSDVLYDLIMNIRWAVQRFRQGLLYVYLHVAEICVAVHKGTTISKVNDGLSKALKHMPTKKDEPLFRVCVHVSVHKMMFLFHFKQTECSVDILRVITY